MKKLVALASMAVLLCASASFAKKAMDEEEMDLVTAAGQPSIIDIEVTTSGNSEASGTTTSSSNITGEIDASGANTVGTSTASAETDPTAFAGNIGIAASVDLPFLGGISASGNGALNIDFADADIETFSLSVASGAVGTLTATASAAASSTVNGAMASVTAMNDDSSTVTLLVASGSQSNLRAIVLNNVAGENQLASGVNIQSGVDVSTGTQSNNITQSWGSTYDWTYAEGSLLATSAAAGDGGDTGSQTVGDNLADASSTGGGGGGGGGGGAPNLGIGKSPCILSTNCQSVDSSGGDGGAGGAGAAAAGDANNNTANNTSGDAGAGGAAAADVGVLQHMPLTIAADKISRVRVNSVGDAIVDVSEMDSSSVSLIVDSNSQNNLAALIVNNVGGRNQVATGINASSQGATVIGNSAGLALVVFDSSIAGTADYGQDQTNTINQFRGTPYQQFAPVGP